VSEKQKLFLHATTVSEKNTAEEAKTEVPSLSSKYKPAKLTQA